MGITLSFNYVLSFLLILRLFGVLFPQTGYIHPDEFFQGPEIAGESLGYDVFKAWEYNSTKPIRSVTFPILISLSSFLPLKYISTLLNSDISSYFVLILPRLLMFCLSLIHDYCIIKISSKLSVNPCSALVIFGSCYVSFVYMIRTFSNCIEAVLFTILLCLTVTSLFSKTKQTNKKNSCREAIIFGSIISAGFFIRPTFLLFSATPFCFWYFHKISNIQMLMKKTIAFLLASSIVATTLLILDTIYFKGILLSPLTMLENIVFTPLNFLLYNSKTSNLKNHGLHPRYFHLVANLPLMFGILGILAILSVINLLYKFEKVPRCDKLFVLSWTVPLIGLSLFPHQEPRFLLPLLVPLVLLHAGKVYNSKCMKVLWVLSNTICAVIFGSVHQGGITQFLLDSSNVYPVDSHTTLFFSHTYMVPWHLLQLKSGQTMVDVRELGTPKVEMIPGLYCKNRCFVVLPGSVSFTEESIERWKGQGKKMTLVRSYFPHLSTESPPKWKCTSLVQNNCSFWQSLKDQLSLHVYQIQ